MDTWPVDALLQMTLNSRCSRLTRRALLFALVVTSVPAPAAALAMMAPRSDGALSPALAELAKPSVRSESPARQAATLGVVANGPGSLLREGNRVLVNVRFEQGAIARLPGLRSSGARVLTSSRRYQTVTVAAAPTALQEVAAIPGVASVTPSLAPILYGSASTAGVGGGSCEGGSVISEGVGQLRVDDAREAFGLRGKGLTVGVLSDSFDTAIEGAHESGSVATHALEDVKSNDLPGPSGTCSGQQVPVNVLEDHTSSESTDEGRAMLQIVHDEAPHASLAFATAFGGSEVSFAENIELLAAPVALGGAGAEVIVDDVSYFEEPFFQDGPVAAAINKVTGEGVTYLTAAGNDNLFEGENEISSWEAPEFRDTTCPTSVSVGGSHCMNFSPTVVPDPTFGITVEKGATLIADLQWAEPWQGVKADLDAYLLNEAGKVLAVSDADNIDKQKPVEVLGWENKSAEKQKVQLVINRCVGSCNSTATSTAKPRLKFELLENGRGVESTEYPKSEGEVIVGPTIYGHAGASSAITVGAVPYNNSAKPEKYSSRGPVTHYFEPVDGTSAAAELTLPEEITKPNVVATDCGATTFFAGLQAGVWRFCGTSAAAPHAAGVAALLLQADPTATDEEIQAKLEESATGLPGFSEDAVGAGLVDADHALEDLGAAPTEEDGPSTVVPALEEEGEKSKETGTVTTPIPTPTPPATPATTPTTTFRWHPPRLVRTRERTARVVFRFASNQSPATFLCAVDGAAFRVCGTRMARRFAIGSHLVQVTARNAAGLIDATPAVFGFWVKRVG
jgi:subtilisin family serine protease